MTETTDYLDRLLIEEFHDAGLWLPEEIEAREQDRRRPAQRVKLTVNNVVGGDENTQYLFEIETAAGDIYASPPVKAGEGQTHWQARIVLGKGETITWRARVLVDGVEFTPVVATRVQVK